MLHDFVHQGLQFFGLLLFLALLDLDGRSHQAGHSRDLTAQHVGKHIDRWKKSQREQHLRSTQRKKGELAWTSGHAAWQLHRTLWIGFPIPRGEAE